VPVPAALAWRIACRSEPAVGLTLSPLSTAVDTVKMERTIRSSRTSMTRGARVRLLRQVGRERYSGARIKRARRARSQGVNAIAEAVCGTKAERPPRRADRAPGRCRAGEPTAWLRRLTGRF